MRKAANISLDKPRVSADFIDIRNGFIFLHEFRRIGYVVAISLSGPRGSEQPERAAPALLEAREGRKRK